MGARGEVKHDLWCQTWLEKLCQSNQVRSQFARKVNYSDPTEHTVLLFGVFLFELSPCLYNSIRRLNRLDCAGVARYCDLSRYLLFRSDG